MLSSISVCPICVESFGTPHNAPIPLKAFDQNKYIYKLISPTSLNNKLSHVSRSHRSHISRPAELSFVLYTYMRRIK